MENRQEPYQILLSEGSGEIIEKKSRFIATLRPVASEEEANIFIEEMKKKYWDARHNCSAFVIGSMGELTRCSDDGEPSGTAGRPMLETLIGSGIKNVCVVVTRYFGGVLLGTGGLVRAYTQAVKEGLTACETATMRYGMEYLATMEYTEVGKVQYLLAKPEIVMQDTQYAENVTMQFFVPYEMAAKLEKDITEGTAGRVKLELLEKKYLQVKDAR